MYDYLALQPIHLNTCTMDKKIAGSRCTSPSRLVRPMIPVDTFTSPRNQTPPNLLIIFTASIPTPTPALWSSPSFMGSTYSARTFKTSLIVAISEPSPTANDPDEGRYNVSPDRFTPLDWTISPSAANAGTAKHMVSSNMAAATLPLLFLSFFFFVMILPLVLSLTLTLKLCIYVPHWMQCKAASHVELLNNTSL